VKERLDREHGLLEARARILRAADPRRALALGFSLTYDATSGTLIKSMRDVALGQTARSAAHEARGVGGHPARRILDALTHQGLIRFVDQRRACAAAEQYA
jgi:hypothetical protein